MKTILVTGAAGYIGRHVVKNALDRGYRVIASDFAFKGLDDRAEFCDVPIFSGDRDIYRQLGSPDICIHLAWRDGFRHNSPAHMRDLSSHVVFLNNLVEGGLQSLSVMGTMHEVGYWEGAINESTPCKPQSQYGIAKNALRQSLMLYEPDIATMFDDIIPEYLAGVVYGALCESVASEQGARRTAMDAATKNAGEMIEHLNLYYNRARQAAITQEITEIVAGADAES